MTPESVDVRSLGSEWELQLKVNGAKRRNGLFNAAGGGISRVSEFSFMQKLISANRRNSRRTSASPEVLFPFPSLPFQLLEDQFPL